MNKLLTGLMLIAATFSAQAETVNLKFDGVKIAQNPNVLINGVNQTPPVGLYNLTEQSGGTTTSLIGFCVDPFQSYNTAYRSYEKSSLDGSDFRVGNGDARLGFAQRLFDNAYDTLGTDATKIAGFHYALWEIFTDDGQLLSGNVKFSWDTLNTNSTDMSVAMAANAFITKLLAPNSDWSITNKYALTFYGSDADQDYLTAKLNDNPTAVPLPAALPLFASALAGFGFTRRKFV